MLIGAVKPFTMPCNDRDVLLLQKLTKKLADAQAEAGATVTFLKESFAEKKKLQQERNSFERQADKLDAELLTQKRLLSGRTVSYETAVKALQEERAASRAAQAASVQAAADAESKLARALEMFSAKKLARQAEQQASKKHC